MYIVEMNNHGTLCKEKFNCEADYNLFAQGMLFGLELTNIKYTFREEINENECITTLKIGIV